MKGTCAVIGSGIAGLAAAVRAVAKGWRVQVFERNDYAGGKIREQHAEGYRFDMGPSVWMLPHLVDELFELCGKKREDYLQYREVETPFRYFFEDGTVINAYADTEAFAEEIERTTGHGMAEFRTYLKDIETKYDITNEVFIENSLHIFTNFLTRKTFSGVLNFRKIDPFKSMDEGNRKFFRDPRLIQIFNNYATYVGSNPLVAPATLNVIQHLEISMGVYFPDKGMYEIVRALVRLAEEMGVTFHYNTLVTEILLQDNRVRGLKLENETLLQFDRVISNMDVYYTYKNLLPSAKPPRRLLDQPKSSSAICFYWGIDRQYPEMGLHNMMFTGSEREEYEAIFDKATVCDDPSLYVFITSKYVEGDAPPGCENWFVMVTAPNDQGQDWDQIVADARKHAIAKISRMLKTDIEKHIAFEDRLTPPMIKDNYLSAFGAIYGNSSNGRFSAFLRHPNFSSRVRGLYFVGGTVHPGPGLPMCLNSAKIVGKVLS